MPTLEHNSMIASLLGPNRFGSDIWVGIYNWAYYDYTFSMDNKEKLTYSNWMQGKPNHATTNQEKCVVMKWRTEKYYHGTTEAGQWENKMCTNSQLKYPWFCSHVQSNEFSRPSYQYPTDMALPLVKCDAGWIPYHTACYKLFMTPLKFDDANKACLGAIPDGALTGNLLTMWDEYEMLFGRTFLRDDVVPNRDPDEFTKGFWIGLQYAGASWSRGWRWIDNWPLTRSNWASNHPDRHEYGYCGAVNSKGQFQSDDCNEYKPYVCKAEFYDFHDDQPLSSKIGDPIECEEGWQLLGQHCIQIFPTLLGYDAAQMDCFMRGANLGSIHTPNYNGYIQGMHEDINI